MFRTLQKQITITNQDLKVTTKVVKLNEQSQHTQAKTLNKQYKREIERLEKECLKLKATLQLCIPNTIACM